MNIKNIWKNALLGSKFTIVISFAITLLLLIVGPIIFRAQKTDRIEFVTEKMLGHSRELYALIEAVTITRNEVIRYAIDGITEFQNQADAALVNQPVQELAPPGQVVLPPVYTMDLDPLIDMLEVKAGEINFDLIEQKFQNIRYFENGYPVMIDKNGILLVHPTQKGADISNTRLFSQMRALNQGTLTYQWPEQGPNRQNRQIYFLFHEGWQVYVGATIDTNEAIRQPLAESRGLMVVLLVTAAVIFILIVFVMIRIITKPINNLAGILDRISKGIYSDNIDTSRGDEIGRIYISLNSLITGLRDTAIFANEIEKKNFEHKFVPLSENDALGNALLDMRNSLMKAEQEEESRRIEDNKRNWTTEGLARFSEILRQNTDNVEILSFNIIKNLVKYLNINQGGLFILNDDHTENKYLELTACYAFNRQKFLTKTIQVGEGITGTCFLEQETIYLKEIPQDYISITSGLGDAAPTSLLLVPLKLNEIVYGVVELASFKEFEPHEILFVEKIAESIASTIAGVKTNLRTAQLLEQSQQQTEEMKAQEEEMRQNMEEMQSTQEELQRRNEEAKKMQEELDKESSLLRALLEYSEDTVYFKDKESKFLRVSNSLLNHWGIKDQNEAIGLSDFDITTYEQAKPKFDAEQEIIRTGKPFKVEEQDLKADGSIRWISTVKMPLYNPNGEIIGTFGISRNITEFKETLEMAKQNEEDLKLKNIEIENLKKELEETRKNQQKK